MSTKTRVSILSVLMALVLIAMALGGMQLFGNGRVKPSEWLKKAETKTGQTDDSDDNKKPATSSKFDFSDNFDFIQKETTGPIALIVTPLAVTNSTVSKTITAVVSSSVESPKLDWTVEGYSSDDEPCDVSDKVTVASASDGALTATVTCHAAFTETIYVKATIRDVGAYGLCEIVFVGIPSEIKVKATTLSSSGSVYSVNAVGSFTMDFELDNVFHSVGDNFNDYSYTFVGFGSVYLSSYNKTSGKLEVSKYGEMLFGSFYSEVTLVGTKFGYPKEPFAVESFSTDSCRFTLTIRHSLPMHAVDSLGGSFGSGGFSSNSFYAFDSIAEAIGFRFTISEKTSGLSKTVTINIGDMLLSKVSLDSDSVEF